MEKTVFLRFLERKNMPEIRCEQCKVYMGKIIEAKLRVGWVILCANCNTKRIASDLKKVGKKPVNFEDIFGGTFK